MEDVTAREQTAVAIGRRRQTAMLVAPPVLVATTWLAFRRLPPQFGPRRGYFLGFLVYWIAWCSLFPLAALGRHRFQEIFRPGRPRAWDLALLALPPALGFGAAFSRAVQQTSKRVVLGSAAIALANGSLEETLWRGAYQAAFPDSALLGEVYPGLAFALWHYAPQQIFPNQRPGEATILVVTAGLVGLLWGRVARRTGSHRWTIASHVLFDFSGLGARIYVGGGSTNTNVDTDGQGPGFPLPHV